MVISVRIVDNVLTHVSRSVKGEHTHSNLQSVRANQGAKVMHHRQLQKAAIESMTGRPIDRATYQRAERLAYREAKKAMRFTEVTRLEVGQILARS